MIPNSDLPWVLVAKPVDQLTVNADDGLSPCRIVLYLSTSISRLSSTHTLVPTSCLIPVTLYRLVLPLFLAGRQLCSG